MLFVAWILHFRCLDSTQTLENGMPLGAVLEPARTRISACVEVVERIAHTGKTEVLLGGGVADVTKSYV